MLGNKLLMARPKTAFLASRKITPDAVMASHAWATKVREEDRVIIGGFQSELEKDVLKFLLRGTCPIVVVRGNKCPKTMPAVFRTAAAANRILILSLPQSKNRRTSETDAMRRNRFVIKNADDCVFGSLDDLAILAGSNIVAKGPFASDEGHAYAATDDKYILKIRVIVKAYLEPFAGEYVKNIRVGKIEGKIRPISTTRTTSSTSSSPTSESASSE